jgi:hypothetical protein
VIEPGEGPRHLGVDVGRERVGERGDEHAGGQRAVAGPVPGLRRRHRHREVGATVERPGEHDDVRAARRLLGQLDRGLGDLGPGVGEEERVDRPGRDVGEARRQRLEQVVGVDVRLQVDAARGLLGDRRDDGRMAVAGGVDGDAGGEVEVLLTVLRRHPTAVPADHLESGHLEPDTRQV